jgi:hypothetical protein
MTRKIVRIKRNKALSVNRPVDLKHHASEGGETEQQHKSWKFDLEILIERIARPPGNPDSNEELDTQACVA